nr:MULTISPECIES: SE1561 family protein [Neobacillus]
MKGESRVGSPIHDKHTQVDFLKHRLNMFLDILDSINPEEADLEDIDRLISMIDELESKIKEFKNRELSESVK